MFKQPLHYCQVVTVGDSSLPDADNGSMQTRGFQTWAACGLWSGLGLTLLVGLGTPAKAAFGSSLGRGARSDRVQDIVLSLSPFPDLGDVPRTRTEAVAHELRRRSPTLNARLALQTAYALCQEAEQLGYDPLLLLAVMRVESHYDHRVVSPVGAHGLMQVMPDTAAWVAPRLGLAWGGHRRFDPVLNVRLGSRYLAALERQFNGRLDLALTAYNRGPGATRRILRDHGRLPRNIRDMYATKVLQSYARFQKRYAELPTTADSGRAGRQALR